MNCVTPMGAHSGQLTSQPRCYAQVGAVSASPRSFAPPGIGQGGPPRASPSDRRRGGTGGDHRAEGQAQRKPKLVRVRRAERCWVIDHPSRLDQLRERSLRERSKNTTCASPPDPHPGDMPDRPFPAVEALVRRVQRVAASRPDPLHILAQTIAMTGTIGVDPYAVLGVLGSVDKQPNRA